MDNTYCAFAHSANRRGHRHGLVEHLVGTAGRARAFGAPFGQPASCYSAALWHDIGKVAPEFQEYLLACENERPHARVNHKDAGAVLAASRPESAHLAPLLLGHHGGILNIGDVATIVQSARGRPDVVAAHRWAAEALPAAPATQPLASYPAPDRDLLMRLIFSALVDADFLDTEEHFDVERSTERYRLEPPMAELSAIEQAAHTGFIAGRPASGRVDPIRAEIRDTALAAAPLPPGLFRLTVPTGGGKTRTGLAFALRHAEVWGLQRVVVAVPFLTITDQTASVYRAILGDEAVLEHHSGVDPAAGRGSSAHLWRRLAAENWDAKVIVTTTLQLFESLFSNRPSSLRKAHRLAKSVVILDEAQALPLRILGVTTDALGALARSAGASIVLCTATQPALEEIDASLSGKIREIVPQFGEHFASLRRVTFAVPAADEAWSWERVANEAEQATQALVVVNRRRDALATLNHMSMGAHHLSTLLCGAHRRHVLKAVAGALQSGAPCHLVSTQVVEAGVDLDFPLVLRALAPFDSVVQAAGRCNREGRLDEGRCVVFRAEERDATGSYRRGIDTLKGMLAERAVDFGDPDLCRAFYARLYGQGSVTSAVVDPAGIREHVQKYLFETVAGEYRLIDEVTRPVVVLYPPLRVRVERLVAAVIQAERPERARSLLRQLQPYLVSLRAHEIDTARSRGLIEERAGLLVWAGVYDMRVGVAAILAQEECVQPSAAIDGGVVI